MQSIAAMSASPRRTAARLSTWAPLTLISAKKRPFRLSGATLARNALMPECDSRPLMTQTWSRRSSTLRAVDASDTTRRLE